MSATAPRAKRKRQIDGREVSSLALISQAVRQVHAAALADDTDGLRWELRQLADEALLLAEQDEPLASAEATRRRIAAERDPFERA